MPWLTGAWALLHAAHVAEPGHDRMAPGADHHLGREVAGGPEKWQSPGPEPGISRRRDCPRGSERAVRGASEGVPPGSACPRGRLPASLPLRGAAAASHPLRRLRIGCRRTSARDPGSGTRTLSAITGNDRQKRPDPERFSRARRSRHAACSCGTAGGAAHARAHRALRRRRGEHPARRAAPAAARALPRADRLARRRGARAARRATPRRSWSPISACPR